MRRKKKEDKFLIMHLEKDGETVRLEMKFRSMIQQAKALKKIAGFWRKGWSLVKLEGNSEYIEKMNQLISGYQPGDNIPIKKMVSATPLGTVPSRIKGMLNKDELKDLEEGDK